MGLGEMGLGEIGQNPVFIRVDHVTGVTSRLFVVLRWWRHPYQWSRCPTRKTVTSGLGRGW